ncbi:MAG: hypothetical protein QNJ54_31465 [Prochloraceae cyanobacterium]|nr:hypothetical protein [Prochloraceae cyanobacterium]
MKKESSLKQLPVIGWREITVLPELGIDQIKTHNKNSRKRIEDGKTF